MSYNHICTLESNKKTKTISSGGNWTSISSRNPKTKLYFRSVASIAKEKERHMLKYKNVIHPLSIFRFCWTIIYACLTYISLLIIPLNVSHGTDIEDFDDYFVLYLLECILDFVCILDMVLTFFTGVNYKSQIILEPRNILKYYIRSVQFYLDLTTSVPRLVVPMIIDELDNLENTHVASLASFLNYFSLLKILRIRKVTLYYDEITENYENYSYNNLLFKYMLIVLMGFQWSTCMLILLLIFRDISNPDLNLEIPDFSSGHISTSDSTTVYCISLYMVSSYFFSNGMSNIVKDSVSFQIRKSYDHLLFFSLAIIGFMVSTFLLVIILQIRLSIDFSKTKYYSIISQVDKYGDYKNLPLHTRRRIHILYEYKFQKKYYREKKILDMLSDDLRKDIYLVYCRTLIESVALLKDLPAEIIAEVVSYLKHEIFLYNDLIVKAGTIGDCMYFIANGSVAVSTPTGREICHLQDGAFFGEIALISNDQKRVANVVAIEICEMYRLDSKDFKACFLTNTNHYRKLEQMAKERLEKTLLLEQLHKKYITEKSKRQVPLRVSQEY